MNLDRWNQIEAIYNSALEVGASEREDFLAVACAGDDELRQEVLSLLSSAECDDSFMEEPALSLGLALMGMEHESLTGEFVGRYKLLELLGRGGMGEVYLAHEPRLNRRLAIKLLPAYLDGDRERGHRFEQEARAASAISHPNVAHIYEIGEAQGRRYITMEYVRGRTLRQALKQGPMEAREALEVAIQVASALAAAHEAGVVHRDIKPENIMLHTDGYVKVLDFGLAKLVENGSYVSDPEAMPLPSLHTEPEMLMGTANYMSPEQIRRHPADQRSDLWSLGVVLYEMLAGRRPFRGSEPSEVIVSILEREPESLEKRVQGAPTQLQPVITRALQKDRDKRYQTAAEMAADLREISLQLKTPVRPHSASLSLEPQSQQLGTVSLPRAQETQWPEDPATAEQPTTTIERANIEAVPAAAILPRPRTPASRFKRESVLALALLLGIVLSGLFIAYRYLNPRGPVSLTPSLRFQPLALPSNVKDVIISPDSKYVTSVIEEDGKQSLHILELSTSSDLQIAGPSEKGFSGLSFSPDGDYIYYLENEAETGSLHRVSKLGGVRRKLLENVNTPVTFSPDETQIAFIRYDMAEQSTVLVTTDADGANETRLVSRKSRGQFLMDMEGAGPAWDPQGNVIACLSYGSSINGNMQINVEAISLRDGSAKSLTPQKWDKITHLLWLTDGSGLILTGSESPTAPLQIWLISYPDGEVSRITNDSNFYQNVSMTKDSRTLLATKLDKISNIWLATPEQNGQVDVLHENAPSDDNPTYRATGISWTPDNKIVYSIRTAEYQNIWMRGAGGGAAKQLTFDKSNNYQPVVTPDGRYIVFVSTRSGGSTIWRMNSDGSQLVSLTHGRQEDMPQVTPDSVWVVYRTVDDVWKVPVGGGEPVLLMHKGALYPVVSPDGRMLACFTSNSPQGSVWSLEVFRLADMSLVKRFNLPEPFDPFAGLRWTPDGRGLTYAGSADGASNIWVQFLDRDAQQKLTDFKDSQILSFGWSSDKNLIACVRGTEIIRALLITGFRNN
jgi:serine/threonine protein kinase